MASIKHLVDFSDRLNPMLVKELRQGLRGVGFVILFITLQALLAFILLITAGAASSDNAGHLLSRTIFFLFSFAVLIVQPLRGISALSSEVRGNTIDLLCLTKLSAWRITFGKWISLVSQSALILTAVIPYLILRYFFGDMQIFSELLLLLSIFLASATLTAFTVGFSGIGSNIIRVLLPIVGSFFLFMAVWSIFVSNRYAYQEIIELFSLTTSSSLLGVLAFVVMCIYAGWMCLDIGCSQIAPVAENRTTLKRTVSFLMISLALGIALMATTATPALITLAFFLCIPICIISLTENPHLVPPIAAPFVKKGVLGKLLGRLLYPGWATGLLFTLVLFSLFQGVVSFYPEAQTDFSISDQTTVTAVFAMLFFSIAMTRVFARKHDNRFGLFILFLSVQFLTIAIIYACEQWSTDLELMPYFCWVPATLLVLNEQSAFSPEKLNLIAWLNAGGYFLIALATTLPVWRQIRETESQIQSNTKA